MAHPGNRPLEIQSTVVNAVYYPNWHVYKGKGPASMPLGQISHILYSFMGVNTDGSLKHLDEHADRSAPVDGVEGGLAALNQVKCRRTHIRTLISVGGGSNSTEFAALAASPQARGRFAHEIRNFVDQNNFNGVDIDWEFPQDEKQGNDYALLLEEVRRALPAPYFLLTTALPPGEWVLRNIDAARVARTLDYMNLMCYDLTGSWSEVSGNHAQLRASSNALPSLRTGCADGVDYLIGRGFPSQKIVMGIPVYARTFPEARGPGGPTNRSGEIDYSELPQEYVDHARIDDSAAAATFVDDKNGFTTFDAPRSVGQKGHFAKHKGLGGLFYWTGSADREGKDSLVITGFNALHGFMGW
ncbi:glycosyl hydrolase family 18 [Colletotrichum sojae]|uniref:chitinase n=1 Tax=Colletotrichum sojae TaxID=2175907 RepID=A0A8H6MXM9_9PEZI|nr:glycosyl hydrolase family 18 [Colletotrichum sojae]